MLATEIDREQSLLHMTLEQSLSVDGVCDGCNADGKRMSVDTYNSSSSDVYDDESSPSCVESQRGDQLSLDNGERNSSSAQQNLPARDRLVALFSEYNGLSDVLSKIQRDFSGEAYSIENLYEKFSSLDRSESTQVEKFKTLITASVEMITEDSPLWEYIAARFVMLENNLTLHRQLSSLGINSLYSKIKYLTERNLYGRYILENYTEDEINEAETFIDDSRNDLFKYQGLELLLTRYVIRDSNHVQLESPQEMFLGISLHLAIPEKKETRLKWVKKFYDTYSKLHVTMATPTLANARKEYYQLSSCFIDTVPDDLIGIYRSINNFAQVSKHGGGMGLYLGKIRALGSDIRGFKNISGGVLRWVKIANDTAVAVDQLGVRAGAVACYLDVWHRDLPEFLQIRTNNGDDRIKAHDVFPAVCYPDLFWRLVRDNIDSEWSMMCPHEVSTVKGWCLEDYYGEEWERRYYECVNDDRIPKRKIALRDLVRLIIKCLSETGTPFTFNRDLVNRMNPNKHKGIIYSSNLCTEIAQNMDAIQSLREEIITEDGEEVIRVTTKPGQLVVCNLASLCLGNMDINNKEELKDTISTLVRALDNVIDVNNLPLLYAKVNNAKYRPIGLGVSGYHHLLAKNKIVWESDKHCEFCDKLFEDINYYTIMASLELAKEKGKYSYFEGSDWETGEYFTLRNYTSDRWNELRAAVKEHGLRNGYLLALAPTSSTSIVAGTTAGVDPVMKRFFYEEKKTGLIPRVAPELSQATRWFYKSAHSIDQLTSVKKCGFMQRHVDQAISMNIYITTDFSYRKLLELYIKAWEVGVKTIYYVRSQSLVPEECESCHA